MTNTKTDEVLGIFISTNELSNMQIDRIQVTDFAIQTILKTIHLNKEVQEEAIDRMIDRTPTYFALTSAEQIDKIKITLTFETVVEYLRLKDYIRENVYMIETGVDVEGTIVISAFYVKSTEVTDKVFNDSISEEQEKQLEKDINIIDSSINVVEEAKKRLKENNVVPFQNRAQRRLSKNKNKVRKFHK